MPTQGRQFSPQLEEHNVLRSSLHFQQVVGRGNTRRKPYSKLYGNEADMTGLRSIGARAFAHVEVHTPKMGDKALKSNLRRFSPNGRSLSHPHGRKGDHRGTQDMTFLETPPGVQRTHDERHHGDLARGVYTNIIIVYFIPGPPHARPVEGCLERRNQEVA